MLSAALVIVSAVAIWALATRTTVAPVADFASTTAPRSTTSTTRPGVDEWLDYDTAIGAGNLSWKVPKADVVDGPRAVPSLGPNAVLTSWIANRPELPLHFSTHVVRSMPAAPDRTATVTAVVRALFGNGPIEPLRLVGDHSETSFSARIDDDMFVAHVWVWGDDVFILGVGAPTTFVEAAPGNAPSEHADADLHDAVAQVHLTAG